MQQNYILVVLTCDDERNETLLSLVKYDDTREKHKLLLLHNHEVAIGIEYDADTFAVEIGNAIMYGTEHSYDVLSSELAEELHRGRLRELRIPNTVTVSYVVKIGC